MFPAQFTYERAETENDALEALARYGADARVLAGGQSLIPAMLYRLARPAVLVDINPLKTLEYLRETDGRLCVGAVTRDFALEKSAEIASKYLLIADTARVVQMQSDLEPGPFVANGVDQALDRLRRGPAHGVG